MQTYSTLYEFSPLLFHGTFFLWPVVRGLTGADSWTIRTQVTYEVIRWAQ